VSGALLVILSDGGVEASAPANGAAIDRPSAIAATALILILEV
jgi:hypothetical protein